MAAVFILQYLEGFRTVHSQYWLLRDYELILALISMGPTVGPVTLNKSA